MAGGGKLRGSISTRGSASQIAFSADSQGVATVGAGALVLFHDIRPDARLRTACAIANRTFSAAERREFGLNAATDPCAPAGDHAHNTTGRVAGR